MNSKKRARINTRAPYLRRFLRFAYYVALCFTKKLFAFDFFFARDSFARLVAYRAARFASGLTGASAFAAAGNFLVSGFRDRFDHKIFLPTNFL